jgi:5,10-methylenetetrahydromethanopterin reductase
MPDEPRTVEMWRFGAAPVPTSRIGERALEFEAQGWDGLAIGQDIGGGADPYLMLAVAAVATEGLKLATAVSTPIRDAMDLANSACVLHALSAGRTTISLGRGDGAFARVAKKPLNTAEFEQYVERVQAYISRRSVDLSGFSTSINDLFVTDPDLDRGKPLLDVSATGPKTVGIAAAHADSVTFAVGADVERLRDNVRLARTLRAEAGLDPASLRLGCYVPAAVVAGDIDRAAAREIIRGAVVRHARFAALSGRSVSGLRPEDEAVSVEIAAQTVDSSRHVPKPPDYTLALPDDFVDRFAVIGEPDECRQRLQAIAATGVDRICLITRVPTTDPDEVNTRQLARYVLPGLR